jgi:phosphatidylserine synthase
MRVNILFLILFTLLVISCIPEKHSRLIKQVVFFTSGLGVFMALVLITEVKELEYSFDNFSIYGFCGLTLVLFVSMSWTWHVRSKGFKNEVLWIFALILFLLLLCYNLKELCFLILHVLRYLWWLWRLFKSTVRNPKYKPKKK